MTDQSNNSVETSIVLHLASPRGCCAGVERAIQTVEQVLLKYGAPVYVRHEIVHNKYVVNKLKNLGAIFIESFNEIPNSDRPIILSAHGSAKSTYLEASQRNLHIIDAICPLVSKVHHEAENFNKSGYHVFLIGHKGHPEVIGTVGQLAKGDITVIETIKDAESINPLSSRLACITQTTLSVMDTTAIINVLKKRFSNIKFPKTSDICFATTNRQLAVKQLAPKTKLFLVLGANNSSNSLRLVHVAQQYNSKATLIRDADDLPWHEIKELIKLQKKGAPLNLGLTASASAPEILVQDVITALKDKYTVKIINQEVSVDVNVEESIVFKVPPINSNL